MTVHCLQHVPFEGLGAIEDWCAARGHAITATRRLFSEPLPSRFESDLLLVLGGPMNVYEHDLYPWLAAEKLFLRRAIADGARVLGICLGRWTSTGAAVPFGGDGRLAGTLGRTCRRRTRASPDRRHSCRSGGVVGRIRRPRL